MSAGELLLTVPPPGESRPDVLLLAVGNPSRGDDALGPLLLDRLEADLTDAIAARRVELLADFQLQIEHALDLSGRRLVIFVDASVEASAPFDFRAVAPHAEGAGPLTHSMSPEALLAVHLRISGPPPPCWLIAIRGERFELGERLSAEARGNLDEAHRFLVDRVRQHLDA